MGERALSGGNSMHKGKEEFQGSWCGYGVCRGKDREAWEGDGAGRGGQLG